ncbi:6c2a50fa-a90d-46ed-966c-e80c47f6c040 [Sclerotinia trifoliorum]|uniref:6c2a50fa-a90d-46ed-966c-e80c47f6c040 n=1 Tax=Sclerotinia trifoliorum TaxID=28548 RepID=A0A8H2W1V5_9HELO|nr:6c2a50fa-a90d-46ed-966c-e80c47f6c040 [Sclerotinia trifoliorum]
MSVTNENNLTTSPIVQDHSTNSLTDNDFSECEWATDSNTDDSWHQSDDVWETQTPFIWGDNDGAQIDWDYENQELPERVPAEPKPVIMIDTLEKLDEFLPALCQLKDGVELAFDCESTPSEDENGVHIPGGGFGRDGDISFLSMTIISMNETYVFDVWELKGTTFERESKDGLSLKKVLESHDRIQLWWDVRTDWDTLFHKFGIQIGKRSRICGLMRAMREEGGKFMTSTELDDWLSEKDAGGDYFRGHGWRPLTARPINDTARNYIAGDTDCLCQLQNRLQDRLGHWAFRMQGKTVGGLTDAIGKQSTLQATTKDLM